MNPFAGPEEPVSQTVGHRSRLRRSTMDQNEGVALIDYDEQAATAFRDTGRSRMDMIVLTTKAPLR